MITICLVLRVDSMCMNLYVHVVNVLNKSFRAIYVVGMSSIYPMTVKTHGKLKILL